jgi:hypothetical protein
MEGQGRVKRVGGGFVRTANLTILDAMADFNLVGRSFHGENWRAWKAFLAALFGLPLEGDALECFKAHTGRGTPPRTSVLEAFLVVGRRGGKSRIAALVGVFLAAFRDYSGVLSPGERGVVMLLAADRRQARVLFRYIEAIIDGSDLLRGMVTRRTSDAIDLSNGITMEVHTASYRSVRGYTVVAAICDEVAFWRSDDAANPDREILDALRPAMATVPGGLLLCISTPYARRGVMWEAYDRHHGQDDSPVLVWQAATREMNETVPESFIEAAYDADPVAAAAEYGGEFRRDIEAFISREALDGVTVPGRPELPPSQGVRYSGFVDPSGGSGDSYTLAVAHLEGDVVVLDAVREVRPPFSPEEATATLAALLKKYHVHAVTGDRYAGEWPREAFRKLGIAYRVADRTKSDLYRDLLPLIYSLGVELLDDRRLRAQLLRLERRTSRAGRDTIDHPPRSHDDVANAVAGVAAVVATESRREVPCVAPFGITRLEAGARDRYELPRSWDYMSRWD